MEIKVGHIEIFVNDIQKAKDFYVNKLGFELISEQPDGKIAWFKSGKLELLIRRGKNEHSAGSYDKSAVALVLYTEDLDQALSELDTKGIKVLGYDGAQNCPVFQDPSGNWIQLVNPKDHMQD